MSMDAYVLGALARGYCHRDNRHKVVDTKLVEAMCSEVMKIVSASEARAEAAEKAVREFGSSRVRDRVARLVGCNADILQDALQQEVRAALEAKP